MKNKSIFVLVFFLTIVSISFSKEYLLKINIRFNTPTPHKKKEYIHKIYIKLKEQKTKQLKKENTTSKTLPKPHEPVGKSTLYKNSQNNQNVSIKNLKIPKDKTLIKNLVNLFLAVGELQKARAILQKAVSLYPDDKELLDTYAKVLLWTNDSYDAISEFFKLFNITHNEKYAIKTFKTALAFHRFNIAIKLLPYVKDKLPPNDISYAYLGAGHINKLIHFLKTQKDEKSMKELVYVLYQKGDLKQAIEYINKIEKIFGIDPSLVLLKANSYYYLKDFKKALSTLVKYKDLVPANDKDYWETLGSLAFYMKDYKDALYAALKNIEASKGEDQDYDIASSILEQENPQKAMEISFQGWKKTHKRFLLLRFMYLALKTQNEAFAIDKIRKLDKKELEKLYKDIDFDMLYAELLYKNKDLKMFYSFSNYILKNSFNKRFLAQYIYALYDLKDTKRMKDAIRTYKAYETSYNLRTPFALIYDYLQDGKKALRLIYPIRKEHPSLYSDILYLYGYAERSRNVRYKHFKSMEERLKKHHKLIDDKEFLRRYLSLGYDFIPPEEFHKLLLKAKKLLPKEHYENIYLSYLISKGYYDKALITLKKIEHPKGWELLSFGLNDYDTYFMYKLLEHKIEELPTRDRVQALVKTGQIKKAMEYAYKGLEANPMDRELYKQFRDLTWQYQNSINIDTKYMHSTPINYFDSTVYGKNMIKDGLYFKYKFDNIIPNHLNRIYYTYAPNFTDYNITLEKLFNRGDADIGFGYFRGLKGNSYASLDTKIAIYNLTFKSHLYYNKPSYNETSYLLFGGMERGVSFDLNTAIENSQSINFTGSYKDFYSQNNIYLGNAKEYYIDYFKQFTEDYPDLALRLYSYGGNYSKSSKTSIINLLYSNIQPIPNNFATSGISLLIGYKKRYEYSHFWYPYLGLDSNYTNNNSIGYDISGGIGGPVIGQDKLIFFIDYDRINGGFKEDIFNIGISYKRIY